MTMNNHKQETHIVVYGRIGRLIEFFDTGKTSQC
jgi:hypothetical protein